MISHRTPKALRLLLPALSLPLAALVRAAKGRGMRILMYHRIADLDWDRLSVDTQSFARQMDLLRAEGWRVVPLASALEESRADDPRPRVALTFDDGYRDFYASAWPVLRERGFPAAVFVLPGLIEGRIALERYRGRPGSHLPLDWAMLKELSRAGVAVGSHGLTHRGLPGLPEREAREEIEESARIIADKVGPRPSWFAYPRGRNTPAVREMVRAAGYRGAVTVAPGACRPPADPFALPRTEISRDDDLFAFRMKLSGAFDPWHYLWQKTPWYKSGGLR